MPLPQPEYNAIPFARDAVEINVIPDTSGRSGTASWAEGFPPKTMIPLTSGGIPPSGQDFNGVLKQLSSHQVWLNAGGQYKFNAALAAAVGGYALGAIVQADDNSTSYVNTINGNTTNPNIGGVGWNKWIDSTLRIDLASSTGASLVGFLQNGSGVVARTILDKVRDVVSLNDYKTSTGTWLDAINAALTYLQSVGGGTLNLGIGQSYLLYTTTTDASTNLINFSGLKNITINFNGSELVVNSAVQAVPRIFCLTDPKNITFNDVRVRDSSQMALSGTSPPNHWGAQFLRVALTDTVVSTDMGGITINNIDASYLDAVMIVDGYTGTAYATNRFRNISVTGRIRVSSCYYGFNFQNNGDDVTIMGVRGANVRRIYYPYGVSNHHVVGSIRGDGLAANAGSTGCILLRSDDFPLRNVTVDFKYSGVVSHGTVVAFVIQPSTDVTEISQIMENVTLRMDFSESLSGGVHANPLIDFRTYAPTSVIEQTSTTHVFKNITVDAVEPSTFSPTNFIRFGAVMTGAESTVYFPRAQPRTRSLMQGWVVKDRANESRFFYGSLNPATINIPFSDADWLTNQMFARVAITCVNPINVQRVYREEYYLIAQISSGGVLSNLSAAKTLTYNSGNVATITLTGSGSNLAIGISGGSFADTNCHARVDFELIDATQRRLF